MNSPIPFFINGVQYELELDNYGYFGPIDGAYFISFDLNSTKEDKRIVIIFSDLVLNMWFGQGVDKKKLNSNLEYFTYQIMSYLLQNNINRCFFHRDENVNKKKGIYYIQASKTLRKTANKLLYGSGNPTNAQIRKSILTVCYSYWQSNPQGFLNFSKLQEFVPVEKVALERNIQYLDQKYLIKASQTSAGYSHIKILSDGIDLFEDPEEFNKFFELKLEQQTVNISGDYIAPKIVGSGNKLAIKSEIKNSFNEIKKEIKSDPKSKKAIEILEKLETELVKDKQNKEKINGLIERITHLPKSINEKILSHPIISQVIATYLTQNPNFITKLISQS